jgi:GTPase
MLPDLALLLVGGNMGVQVMTKEHISIACALQIPLAVVVTKVDIAPEVWMDVAALSCLAHSKGLTSFLMQTHKHSRC